MRPAAGSQLEILEAVSGGTESTVVQEEGEEEQCRELVNQGCCHWICDLKTTGVGGASLRSRRLNASHEWEVVMTQSVEEAVRLVQQSGGGGRGGAVKGTGH